MALHAPTSTTDGIGRAAMRSGGVLPALHFVALLPFVASTAVSVVATARDVTDELRPESSVSGTVADSVSPRRQHGTVASFREPSARLAARHSRGAA